MLIVMGWYLGMKGEGGYEAIDCIWCLKWTLKNE